MSAMPPRDAFDPVDDGFLSACDALSAAVDAVQFERLRWARTEAPMLAHLVELAHGAVADRGDIDLFEEGSGVATRRYVVKVHGHRIFAIVIELAGQTVSVQAEKIARSHYPIEKGDPLTADFKQFDQELMAAALGTLFARVKAKPD